MTTGLINKLISVLEATLGKLGRYDEGSLIGSFLSFTVRLFFGTLNILTKWKKPLNEKFVQISDKNFEEECGYIFKNGYWHGPESLDNILVTCFN